MSSAVHNDEAGREYIGVSVGGGRGKTTAVARLERRGEQRVALVDARVRVGQRGGGRVSGNEPNSAREPFRDEVLLDWLCDRDCARAVLAMDVPLTLPPCIRCELVCPGTSNCQEPSVMWMRTQGRSPRNATKSPLTPYTQRACELLLERATLQPRETLGQGMGPLAARAAFLVRAMRGQFDLHRNLIEVHPRATLIRLFGEERERRTRRGELEAVWAERRDMLDALTHDVELVAVWPDIVVRNVHVFHATVSAFSAMFWHLEAWRGPMDLVGANDAESDHGKLLRAAIDQLGDLWRTHGWIWVPPLGRLDRG